jgi:hypothetical protein
MTYDDARAFWFAVDESMVPGTDYTQLETLLPWVMTNVGMDRYLDALELALREVRLGEKELPKTFGENTAAIQLVLPDEEIFTDGHWALLNVTVNPDKLVSSLVSMVFDDENGITSIIDLLKDAAGKIGVLKKDYEGPDGKAGEEELDPETMKALEEKMDQLQLFMGEYFQDVVFQDLGAAGSDGRTITTVGIPGYTVPILIRAKIEGMSVYPTEFALLVCLDGEWIDLTLIIDNLKQTLDSIVSFIKDRDFNRLLDIDLLTLLDNFFTVKHLMDNEESFLFEVEAGEITEIPNTGLDSMTPHIIDTSGMGETLKTMLEEVRAQSEDAAAEQAGAEAAEAESGTDEGYSSEAVVSAEDTDGTESTDDELDVAA